MSDAETDGGAQAIPGAGHDVRVCTGRRSVYHKRAWVPVAQCGAVFALSVALLLRHPAPGGLWHTLYAEDGRFFLQCRLDHGLTCLAKPYQGYLQTMPRLLLELVPSLPIAQWALAVAIVVVAVDALCLVLVFHASAWLLPAALPRALAVAVIATSGAAHIEVAGNTANLHWWLLLSAVFVSADRNADDRLGPTGLRTAWLVLVCLSEALTPVIVVAYAAGLVLRRSRRGRWSRCDLGGGGVVLVAAVSQFVVALVEPRLKPAYPAQTVPDVLHDYWTAVVQGGWSGPVAHGRTLGRVVVVCAALALLAAVALRLRRRSLSAVPWLRALAGVLLALGSLAALGASVLANDLLVPRYAFLPFAFLVLSLVVVVGALVDGWGLSSPLMALGAAAILLALLAIGPYPPLVATRGPSWSSQVRAGQQACAGSGRTSATLTTSPNPRWYLIVSCSRLKG